MFHLSLSSPPSFHSSSPPSLPLPPPPPPLPVPVPVSDVDVLLSSDVADGLYALHSQPSPSTRAAALAQLDHVTRLSVALFSLLDPDPHRPFNNDPASALSHPSPSSSPCHLHSGLQYYDRHQHEEQSLLELLPLLVQLTDALASTAAALLQSEVDVPVIATEPPPLPANPYLSSSDALLSSFLDLHWPFCCLVTLTRVCLSLPFSSAQLLRLQWKLLDCIEARAAQEGQPSSLSTPMRSRPSLGLSLSGLSCDWLPLVQSLFHLTVRFSSIDAPHSSPLGTEPSHDDIPSLPAPPTASWLSLLHCALAAHRPDLLSSTHYILDTRLHHSPAFCSYLHRQYRQHLSAAFASPAFCVDAHHLSLLVLLAGDEDYRERAFSLLTLALAQTTGPSPPGALSVEAEGGPVSFFRPTIDASHSAVRLWSAVLRMSYLEQKASVLLDFALHQLQAESPTAPLVSVSFHLVLLLFSCIPATRSTVLERLRCALFHDPLSPSHRRLHFSLLSFLVLSSPPSHLSPLREPVKLLLDCLTLAPLSVSLPCLLALLPCFLPSSALSVDDLVPFLHKWLRALKADHPLLSLCATLWLLGRWSGWEEEERGLMKLMEEGWRRLSEEGRAWMFSQLTAIVDHSLTAPPISPSSPTSTSFPLSLSASTEAVTLSSVLAAVTFGLSPAALASLLGLLCRHLQHYVNEKDSAAVRRSKWSLPTARLQLTSCFRLEWSAARAEEEDEDDIYARIRREQKLRRQRRRGKARAERIPAAQQPVDAVALRDPIPVLLRCAWAALRADAAAFSSASPPTASALLALISALVGQLLDAQSLLSLLHPQSMPAPPASEAKELADASMTSDAAAPLVVQSVSESLISPHQRWSLLQALCLVLGRVLWDDTRRWRESERGRRKAMDIMTPPALSSLHALKAKVSTEVLPLSSFVFSASPPVQQDEAHKGDKAPFSPFTLLTPLSSAAIPALAEAHLLLLEQGAFLGLLLDCSPATSSPVSLSLAPRLLLSSPLLCDVLREYVDSVRRLSVASPLGCEAPKASSTALPSLSLVAAAFLIKWLIQGLLPTSSPFPTIAAASLLPSFTPASSADTAASASLASASFGCVLSAFCATLGVREAALTVAASQSSAPFPCSPPSSLSKAVFASARHLSSVFDAAATHPLRALSPSSAAWSKATAVFEQPEQYKEEVWNLRAQALTAMTRLIQQQPGPLPSHLPSSASLPASAVLALLLVRLFVYELEHQLTVPLAHAYIDCIQTLHSLAPTASPSPLIRITEALLPFMQPSSPVLGADHRLARKVYRHVFTSLQSTAAHRRRAMELTRSCIDGMWKAEQDRERERQREEALDQPAADRRWAKRLRSRRRSSRAAGGADEEAFVEDSDDSDFDEARERRQQRFLSRFSRTAMVELDRLKEEDRRDRQELKEKKIRKELLLAIARYCAAELKAMRAQLKAALHGGGEMEGEGEAAWLSSLSTSVHDGAVLLSHVVGLVEFLTSASHLQSLLDCSFAASSIAASDALSLRLLSPLASLLHDAMLTIALTMRRVHALVSHAQAAGDEDENAAAEKRRGLFPASPSAAQLELGGGSCATAGLPFRPHLTASSPASALTFLHLARHVALAISSASPLLSFLSSTQLPASKVVDTKLAIAKAREATLALIAALRADWTAADTPPEAEEATAEAQRGKRRRSRSSGTQPTASHEASARAEEKVAEGGPQAREEESAGAAEWLRWLNALHSELETSGSRRGPSARAVPATVKAAALRRKRGSAVLHSRNRFVDALLQEERETQDSFMDLEDFLV